MKHKLAMLAILSGMTLFSSCDMEGYRQRQEQARILKEKQRQEQLIAFENKIDSLYSKLDGFAKYDMPFIQVTSKKESFTLDLFKHMANEIKAVEVNFPVSQQYFDSIKVGQTLDEVFNAGGFLYDGELSNYKTYISDKFNKDMYISIQNSSWQNIDTETYNALINEQKTDSAYVQSSPGIFLRKDKNMPSEFNSKCAVRIRSTKYNITLDLMKNLFNSMNEMNYTIEFPGFLCNQIKPGQKLDETFVGASLLFSNSPSVVEYYVVSK